VSGLVTMCSCVCACCCRWEGDGARAAKDEREWCVTRGGAPKGGVVRSAWSGFRLGWRTISRKGSQNESIAEQRVCVVVEREGEGRSTSAWPASDLSTKGVGCVSGGGGPSRVQVRVELLPCPRPQTTAATRQSVRGGYQVTSVRCGGSPRSMRVTATMAPVRQGDSSEGQVGVEVEVRRRCARGQ